MLTGRGGSMNEKVKIPKPVVFTNHALHRMKERGTSRGDVLDAIRMGQKESAQKGRSLYRLNLEFKKNWDGKYYRVQQIVPVVKEEEARMVVIIVYTFYFQEEDKP